MAAKKKAVPKKSGNGVASAVNAQIDELNAPTIDRQVKTQAVLQSLRNLEPLIGGQPTAPPNQLLAGIIDDVAAIAQNTKPLAIFGKVLADLDRLGSLLPAPVDDTVLRRIGSVGAQIKVLLNSRSDVQAVLNDLEALRHLRGGPADATAFHDFNVLQIAFKSVWQHAYDKNLQALVEDLYLEHMKLYDDADLELPNFGSITDVNDLMKFFEVTTDTTTGQPEGVAIDVHVVLNTFGSGWVWNKLSPEQQYWVWQQAGVVNDPSRSDEDKAKARRIANAILENPAGPASRIATLLYKLGQALAEPYAFDVFAPHSYNFGLMLTYRQKWEPGEYQAGDLVATVPLAPGESRKYSTRQVVKQTRAAKEVEKSLSSSAYQTSETSRAEADIMKRTTTATNFKLNANGSFNIGIGSINSSTEFSTNQGTESAATKKDFHEATLKAAQEYRLERSLEVDTTSSVESEQTTSGEIANPNNEITVTYLFYELQRRYKITESLYRVTPVILVALDMPAPHEIDEAWLIQYQWIIARALLDDSFRPALTYLNTGFAGDELATEVRRAHWETQREAHKAVEGQVDDQRAMRDALREVLEATALGKAQAEIASKPGLKQLADQLMQRGADAISKIEEEHQRGELLEAQQKAAESRLKYVEEALAQAQEKEKQTRAELAQATDDYTAALQNKFSRRVAIDQLRIHVKQNILYYMQAIWSQAVADQTFFELYKLPIVCPEPSDAAFAPQGIWALAGQHTNFARGMWHVGFSLPSPSSTWNEHELVELADLDHPLGFKGNFIIFPMKQHCYLTLYMLQTFVDGFTNGLRDPDKIAYFLESFDRLWLEAQDKGSVVVDGETFTPAQLKQRLQEYGSTGRRSSDEIIVPTGQLFIEALPGSHPVLEDFKLLHRIEDVRKVKAEVRHAELENVRLAARVLAGQLRDPDIEKTILVEGDSGVTVDTN